MSPDVRPSGTVSFLFTDIEGSTSLWERDPVGMRRALARHDEILRSVLAGYGGHVFSTAGDAFSAAFASPVDAVRAALAIQEELGSEAWPTSSAIRVRVGLHTGTADERDGDYFGPTLNRGARIMAAGHGGQILISGATAALLLTDTPLTDLGEHRLRDLATTEHLWQVGSAVFPAVRTLSTFQTNLPVALTSFVGREAERAELAKLLDGRRLVTLTGAGGSGKTRLAMEFAAGGAERFRDGAWLVELSRVTTPDAVLPELLGALGLVTMAGQSPLARVVEFLAERQALLIVDNCEHLLDAAAELIEQLLEHCPALSVLTTSREVLSVPGEQVYGVRSLEVTALDGTGWSDAARLFIERARDEQPGLEVTPAKLAVIEQICTRLDGMPLAIELAAGRARAITLEEIAHRLDERFKLLGGGRRGRVERHQTLRATVEWSFGLLTAEERRVFAALSVFAGNFDLAAAIDVCAAVSLDEYAVLDDLDSLVAKSMVVGDEHPSLGMRYRLLETLRAYGNEQLVALDQFDAVRDAYVAFYLGRAYRDANTAEAGALWADPAMVLSRLAADAAEYRSAVGHLRDSGQMAAALDLAADVASGCFFLDWWEPHRWLADLLADPATTDLPGRSDALGVFAVTTWQYEADAPRVEALAAACLACRWKPEGAGRYVFDAEGALSASARMRGDWDEATRTATPMARAGAGARIPQRACGLFYLSMTHHLAGRPAEALAFAREVDALRHANPYDVLELLSAWSFGTALRSTEPERAARHLEGAIELGRACGSGLLTRAPQVDLLTARLAHLLPREAAGAARDVVAALWEARSVAILTRAIPLCFMLCVRAGALRDAALIDGWLAGRGAALVPDDRMSYDDAVAAIDAGLGPQARLLREQGAPLTPAEAVAHVLAALDSIEAGAGLEE